MSEPVPPPSETTQPYAPAYPSYPTAGIQPYDRHELPPSKTKAVWALALACLPLPIVWLMSLILSIQVLGDSKHGRDHGRRMAIAALIIMPAWIIVGFLVYAVGAADDADRDASGVVTHTGDVSTTKLRPGDCTADDLAEKTYITIEVTPCRSAHYFETYATFALADGDFPGQDEVDRLAEGGCVKRFARYVGVPVDDSKLHVVYLRPAKSSWAVDHGVACLVTTGSRITESLKFSKR